MQVQAQVSGRLAVAGGAMVLAAAGACALLALPALRPGADGFDAVLAALAGAAAAALALLLLFRSPGSGLGLLLIPSLLLPGALERLMDPKLNAAFVFAPVVAGTWLLSSVRILGAPSKWLRRLDRPVLLLMAAFSISFAVGHLALPGSPAPLRARAGGLAIVLLSGVLFLMASRVFHDERRLAAFTWLFLAAGAVRLAMLYLPGDTYRALYQAGLVPSAPLGSMFWTWFIALTAGQIIANRALGGIARAALVLLLSLAVYITFFQWCDWASGWLPGFVAVAAILVFRRPRAAAVLACAAICLAAAYAGEVATAIWTADQQYSFWSRFAAARVLWDIASQNLLLGLGPANYYHQTALYPIFGWHVHFSSHNTYLDLVLQAGLLGLGFYLWFFAAVWRHAVRIRHRIVPGFAEGYLYGAIGGVAGTLCAGVLGDWVLPFAYNVGVEGFRTSILAWIFMGGAAALASRPAEGGLP